jgi:poly(3-hydroxybutyrate) depolymerase
MRPLPFALIVVAACSSSTSSDGPGDGPNTPDAKSSSDAPPSEARPTIPTPTGTCPVITKGDVTFAPAGIPPRKVKLELDPAAASQNGALVLYWHATGSSTLEAGYALGSTQAKITSTGGIIASPYSDPAAGQFEWYLVNGSPKQDDFVLADEIVACLAAANRIDVAHIHSMGMSAGALQTSALSLLRASYIASVATFSGGLTSSVAPASQNPENKFAALIFVGGAADSVFGVDFVAASKRYQELLLMSGHFAAVCNHSMGHTIPLDAAPSVAMFFEANGFGAWPSPYANGLPASFPAYCGL